MAALMLIAAIGAGVTACAGGELPQPAESTPGQFGGPAESIASLRASKKAVGSALTDAAEAVAVNSTVLEPIGPSRSLDVGA